MTKSSSTKVTIRTETLKDFAKRGLAHARAMDSGDLWPSEIAISFAAPHDMMRVFTAKRIELLEHIAAAGTQPLHQLATILKRDRRAVGRDVNTLRELGLVSTDLAKNTGHGRRLLVKPVARSYEFYSRIGSKLPARTRKKPLAKV